MSLVNWPAAIVGFLVAFALLGGTFLFAVPPAAAALGYLFPIFLVLLALCYIPACIVAAAPSFINANVAAFCVALVFVTIGVLVEMGAAAALAFATGPPAVVIGAANVVATANAVGAGASVAIAGLLGLLANAVVQILLVGLVLAIADFVVTVTLPSFAAGPVTIDGPSTELNMRAVLIGINVFVNLAMAVLVYPVACVFMLGPGVGAVVAFMIVIYVFMASISPLYRDGSGVVHPDVRSALGWTAWLLPTFWIMEAIGILLYALSMFAHVLSLFFPPIAPFCGITGLTVRRDTGTIVMTGGFAANLGQGGGAYTPGSFVFDRTFTVGGPPPPASTPGGLEHEVGHHLNAAAFGSYFTLIGWFGEGMHVVFGVLAAALAGIGGPTVLEGWSHAYAEQLASTNITTPPARTIGTNTVGGAAFTTTLRMWG